MENDALNKPAEKQSKRRGARQKQAQTAGERSNPTMPVETPVPDVEIMDNETEHMYADLNQEIGPVINLESQAANDTFLDALIQYLQNEILPDERIWLRGFCFRNQISLFQMISYFI
jgi:hypothetical protein